MGNWIVHLSTGCMVSATREALLSRPCACFREILRLALGWECRWQTTFSVQVSKSTAPKVLSVLAAALEARGARVTPDAAASSLTAVMTTLDAASEDTSGAEVTGSTPEAAEESAGPNEHCGEGTPIEQHRSDAPIDAGQTASESAGSETGSGRAAKRQRVVEGVLPEIKESERGGADGVSGTSEEGEKSRTYNARVRLFQEASNKVAVSASIAGSESLAIAVHFTEMLGAVQTDVAHILS